MMVNVLDNSGQSTLKLSTKVVNIRDEIHLLCVDL